MIQVLCFKKGHDWITKDTPDLEEYGAFLREIEPVLCRDGLALQKCDTNLYALIHVRSGWALRMWSITARMAEDWFNAAVPMTDWTASMEAIVKDPKVVDALRIGKEMEERFLFTEDNKKVKAEQEVLPGM